MGSVPTLCALTNPIKVKALHMALLNTFDSHTGTKLPAAKKLSCAPASADKEG